jgi:hypothetical protein
MFNSVLGILLENERVEVYEKSTEVKAGGGTSITWTKKETILCNIQAGNNFGEELLASNSGDTVNEVYNMYSKRPLKEGQRIKRIDDDNLLYEVRKCEHNGKKTILEHYKTYITRIDNQ